MKHILFIATCIAISTSCLSQSKSAKTNGKYPYKATYSSEIKSSGNDKNALMVLNVWKAFESGNAEEMDKAFADTVLYENASGFRYYGSSLALLKMACSNIPNLDSMRFDISQWQTVHVNDKNEDWVYIWADERTYPKNGNADTTLMHEQWRIQNNKVVYFNEFKAKVPR